MSSGFVSGGTADNPVERDDEWLKAQQEIEATRRRKEEESRQQDGKTLFDVLQANKAAKQEAFEESIRLKNQFRSLDEDEVDFLDSVLESTRAKEAAVKKETTEQLDLFRKQQEEADKAILLADTSNEKPKGGGGSGGSPAKEEQWVINGRKRKKGKEKEALPGVKLRKGSSTNNKPDTATAGSSSVDHHDDRGAKEKAIPITKPNYSAVTSSKSGLTDIDAQTSADSNPKIRLIQQPTAAGIPSLGLGDYSSDDDG